MTTSARKQVIPNFAASNLHEVVQEVSSIVSRMAGIELGEKQFSMVENRLRSRMIRLGLSTPGEYLQFLESHLENESQALLSLLTTHHTYFFREFQQFEYLLKKGLSQAAKAANERGDRTIRVWSAACSRGQEVYSLAMFLKVHLPQYDPQLKFEIYGTDVDPESVKVAANGVYPYKELTQVPSLYLEGNWVKGTGEISDFAKIKSDLRDRCSFGVFNLVDPKPFTDSKKFDFIFCRNVYIYFNPHQIKKSSEFLMNQLTPEGLFFVGISETLSGLGMTVQTLGPSIYSRMQSPAKVSGFSKEKNSPRPLASSAAKGAAPAPSVKAPAAVVENSFPDILKVLCVDDSSSILTLLKKVLGRDQGFEVVATASNGREAIDMLKRTKVDVVTLDIHMPEMDGITFLQKNMSPQHPPVVMLTSVSRENADLAFKALDLGASDYVEKPTLANLMERGDEIRAKLKLAFLNRGHRNKFDLDKSFKHQFKVSSPDKKLRAVFITLGERRKIFSLCKNSGPNDPPLILVFEGASESIEALAKEITESISRKVKVNSLELKPGEICLWDFKTVTAPLANWMKSLKTSVFVAGVPTEKAIQFLNQNRNFHLVVEDLGIYGEGVHKKLNDVRSIVPLASYLSVSEEYLG